ncbi:MAG: hypothetical protein E7K43_19495 [Bacillus subtilis]|nr:hypothetical protein [Bacillus subtilis]
MNWMEFVSSIVKSVIWPIAIIILVIKLRQPVSNLISTLARIKYKDWEFEFKIDQKLEKISLQLNNEDENEVESQSSQSNLTSSLDVKAKELDDTYFSKRDSDRENLKDDSDLKLKIEMLRLHGAVNMLYKKVSEKDDSADKRDFIGLQYMLDYLKHKNVLNESFADSLIDLLFIVHDLENSHISQTYLINKFLWNVDKSVKKLIKITEDYIAKNDNAEKTSN